MAFLLLFIFLLQNISVHGACYFDVEFQGIFLTQSALSAGSDHKYSEITVLPDAIPAWGKCHEMKGDRVILHDFTGGKECFRCFRFALRSPNVIQMHTEGLDTCYSNEGTARASCPTDDSIRLKISREIMLYKSRSFTPDGEIDRVSCPFNGKYDFTYDVNDQTENFIECPDFKSTLSNCPRSSELSMRFTECKFQEINMTLRCLGHWKGMDGYQYFALWDTSVASVEQPQYRCAMYHVEPDSGRVFISFSIDATCTNRLQSPWDGYEMMVLFPTKGPSSPAPVRSHSCIFPQWAQGQWRNIKIRGRELIFHDVKSDKVYQTVCLVQNNPMGERFSLYSVNQCGEEEFTCIWIKSRDRDVLEFKIASLKFNYFNNEQICSDNVFVGQDWITEGRLRGPNNNICPVVGVHTGVIPDAPDLCARLTSDCGIPALMYYEVLSCANSSQIFETYGGRVKRDDYSVMKWREDGQNPRQRNGRRLNRRKKLSRRIPVTIIRGDTTWQSYKPTIQEEIWQPRNARRHKAKHIKNENRTRTSLQAGFDPSFVFPYSVLPEVHMPVETTRLPFVDEAPSYYYVDKQGKKINEVSTTSFVVSERKYQCLGRWKEDGVIYTFTYRLDVNTYECFAGVLINENEAYIAEAGVDCRRGLQPVSTGMKLVKQSSCPTTKIVPVKTLPPSTTEEQYNSTAPSLPSWWPSTSKKPKSREIPVTTQRPLWKNHIPHGIFSSSSKLSIQPSIIVIFLFYLLLCR